MTTPDQVYKTHINATPEKVWNAITNPEFTRQYWFGNANVAAKWETGEAWQHKSMDNDTVYHIGKILECDPPRRLVLSWKNPDDDIDVSKVIFEITPMDAGAELIVRHCDFIADSAIAKRVANGWPRVVAGLKEFLELGQATASQTHCACA